jgi:hypothetical protein
LPSNPCPCHHHSSSSNRATALAMPDVVTPTCLAISAIDNPNSSRPHFAILARRILTFLRRLPPLSSFGLIRPFRHSSSIILFIVLPLRRSFSWRLVFSSASSRISLRKSPLPRIRSSDSSFWPLLRADTTWDHPPLASYQPITGELRPFHHGHAFCDKPMGGVSGSFPSYAESPVFVRKVRRETDLSNNSLISFTSNFFSGGSPKKPTS